MTTSSHWADLVSVALLGTDRRDPPVAPPGPVATLALEVPAGDAAGAFVRQVAVVTALRRAASLPPAAIPSLVPHDPDPRPMTPVAAGDILRRVVVDWPILEREWLRLAAAGGWRLAPDLVPLLLARHRAHADVLDDVRALAGPVAPWLVDLLPTLAPASRRSAPGNSEVALPPELATVVDGPASGVVGVIADGLRRQRYSSPTRHVLVAAVARVRPDQLAAVRARLEGLDPQMAGIGVAYHLADMAALRLAMHQTLVPTQEFR